MKNLLISALTVSAVASAGYLHFADNNLNQYFSQANNSSNQLKPDSIKLDNVKSDTIKETQLTPLANSIQSVQANQPSIAARTDIPVASPAPNHSLDFENLPAATAISVSTKSFDNQTDGIFKDGLGREVLMRGWNTSGAVKLKSMQFKPFKNVEDAAYTFSSMKKIMGANQIRFTVAWEGIHTAPDEIDYAYLDDIIAQMREAIKQKMYVVVDYHSDLYSRHTFTKDSNATGNGAPEWIVKGGNHGTDRCGLPCLVTWGAHKLSDPAVRSAIRSFWLNHPISTTKGTRYVQDEFLWQLGKVSEYLNQQLTAQERAYLLGIEPLNEPFDGGIKELGLKDYSEFDNLIIWPFYEKVRQVMNDKGMSDKLVYAEPLVFWYTTTGVIAPATGKQFLKNKPSKGFVFAPHMYDQGRMGVSATSNANNGVYLNKLDEAREEARFLGNMPVFLGEYGMWNKGQGVTDTHRIINASIQGLESSNAKQTASQSRNKSRYVDFYTPWIHGAQWHWNYYYGNSREMVNDNPNRIETRFDAWNNENFSVVKDFGRAFNHDANLVQRIIPRRTQGDMMHFSYNAKTVDTWGKPINWSSLRLVNPQNTVKHYFKDRRFAVAVWRGRQSDAPTEIFIPNSFDPNLVTVITDAKIQKGFNVQTTPQNQQNELLLLADNVNEDNVDAQRRNEHQQSHRLMIWDDVDANETNDSIHYAIIAEHTQDITARELATLQSMLTDSIVNQQQSPVYLTNDMAYNDYQADDSPSAYFQLKEQRGQFCLDVSRGNTNDGNPVWTYWCNNSNAQKWEYDATTKQLRSALNARKCLTTLGVPDANVKLGISTCTANNPRQQFIKNTNDNWSIASDSNLRINAFGGGWGNIGLATANNQSNQIWRVSR